ncbi:MAG: recombinase family protein [Dehalococcoidia bacterium]|nr:recombinase family protein [Dehalococcoidia bacterium]
MRALGYYRTQDARTGEEAFAAYCAEHRHIPYGVFAEQGEDHALPGFQEMLRHIETSGLGYLVVVPSVEHLGASIREQVERMLELDALNCEVVCDDPETPDPLQAAVRAAKGEEVPDDRRERIREGMRAKAARGLGLGKPPYGYKVAFDGTLRVAAQEAEVVRAIFSMYLNDDLGVRASAARLNVQSARTRKGRRWSMVTVRDILRNPAYMGAYRRFGLLLPGALESIVAPADFRAVQEKMSSRRPVRKHPRSQPFLLAGLLFCGHCGRRMMGVTRRQTWRRKDGERRRGEYRYYQCQSRINNDVCAYRTVRAERVEEEVVSQLRSAPALAAAPPRANGGGNGAAPRKRDMDKGYMTLVERAAAGAMTMAQLRAAVAVAAASREAAAHAAPNGPTTDEEQAKLAPGVWPTLAPAERQGALQALVARVTLKDGAVQVAAQGAPASESAL